MEADQRMQSGTQEVIEEASQCAEQHLLGRFYGKAFDNFLIVLQLAPERRQELKQSFALCLREWGEQLETEGKLQDLLMCYHKACQVFPECEATMNNMGAQLFKLGFLDEAVGYFRKALRVDPDYLQARENLENTQSHLVERWHFPMLNDKRRNLAYKCAIWRAVKAGASSVLDIGSGTGLLSMFAVQSGAKSVTACEASKTMFELSRDCVAANEFADKMRVVNKLSTDLQIPEDINEKASLIVTEVFDAGLLGEGIIPSLRHAWRHLIKSPGKVIPNGAEVFLCAIESSHIRKDNRFMYPGMRHLDLSSTDFVCTTARSDSDPDDTEPYTSEKLPRLNGGYTCLSEPAALLCVDFNDVQSIDRLNDGFDLSLDLPVTSQGRLDAIALWFNLQLDADTKLSSGPESGSCWEQAVYPVLPAHGSNPDGPQSLKVNPSDVIKCSVRCQGDAFVIHRTAISRRGCQAQKGALRTNVDMSSGCDDQASCYPDGRLSDTHDTVKVLDRKDTGSEGAWSHHGVSDTARHHVGMTSDVGVTSDAGMTSDTGVISHCEGEAKRKVISSEQIVKNRLERTTFYLERTEIQTLNNLDWNQVYCFALERIRRNLTQDGSEFTVLFDFKHTSLLPIQALKMGASCACVLTAEENSSQAEEILRHVAAENGVAPGMLETLPRESHHAAREGSDAQWSVLVTDLVEPCGSLRQQALEDITLTRLTCMPDAGLVVPQVAKVIGMLVESPSLLADSRLVSDESTLGLRIAEFVNDFQMTNHVGIDLATLEYKKLSDPFEMLCFDMRAPPGGEAGTPEAVSSFLNQSTTCSLTAVETGCVTALVYWFDLTLYDDIRYCTLDSAGHFRQAAILVRSHVTLSCGENVVVEISCKNSCLSVSLDTERS